ncbi:hypothetical protein [Aquincola sp. J276]|uniref:hypothetical protein n=1 Tax=Aquincola sp. J276 TaxID=2898432 RepID=UPI002150CE46|nr:hypothetical protein [Aquincola sp. J276]MCR5867241.1 hypothetical protein [Aquincola sp. J276]
MKKYMRLVPSALAALVLVACGGGGGSGGGEAEAAPALPAAASATGDAAGPTDAAALALATLNTERERCGFGSVRRHAALDTAAGWHAAYLKQGFAEGRPASHQQEPSRAGFVAATPAERVLQAGYDYAATGEYLSFVPLAGTAAPGDALVRAMLATVYHLAGMLDGNRDVGIAVARADSAPPAYRQAILAWETGTPRGSRPTEPAGLVTYPCAGSSGLQPFMYGESPDPFTALGFAAGPGTGHPLYLRAPAGTQLRLAVAQLTHVASGRPVPVQLYHASDDPQRLLGAHQAFAIPREPLEPGASYRAQLQGSVDGVPFTREFTFGTMRF